FQEDIAIPFRATLCGKLLYVDEPLVRYRRHSGGMWSGVMEEHSSAQARRRFKRWARNVVFLNMGFRRDVETALRCGNLATEDAERLRHGLAVRRREVHSELLIQGDRSLPVKMLVIMTSVARGTSIRKAVRWTLMLTAMPLYLRILRAVHWMLLRKSRSQA